MPPRRSYSIPTWVKYWLAWTAAGLFYITQDAIPRLYRNESVPFQRVFTGWMAAMYICAALTPAILWLGRRWPIEQPPRGRRAVLHFCCSAVFSVVSSAVEVPVLIALGVFPPSLSAGFWSFIVHAFHGGVVRYWAVVGLQAIYRSHHQARQREREALELRVESSELAEQLSFAQLSALKMQLHPHFLFNTLSAISVLVRQQKGHEAEMMLARLSDLLRHTLDDVETQEVPLWRELEFLSLYLSIEQVRFQDRLRIHIDAGPGLSDALVPHLVLQPIVENAIRHGLGQSEEAVLVQVNAVRSNRSLVLTVMDDGPGSPSGFEGKGIGLRNVRSRLDRLYCGNARLTAENMDARGVKVTLTLPFRPGRPEDEECA